MRKSQRKKRRQRSLTGRWEDQEIADPLSRRDPRHPGHHRLQLQARRLGGSQKVRGDAIVVITVDSIRRTDIEVDASIKGSGGWRNDLTLQSIAS